MYGFPSKEALGTQVLSSMVDEKRRTTEERINKREAPEGKIRVPVMV